MCIRDSTSGISSFSPKKAITDEIEISLPVSIRYNQTFSTEGIIHIRAVKGELENFVSTLEFVCQLAKQHKPISFSKFFEFSYPINVSGNKICMLENCKVFSCPYPLNFSGVGVGEHLLHISFDQTTNEIKVKEWKLSYSSY